MAALKEIADGTGAAMARAFRASEASPVAVTEHLLDRIERSRADNIFLAVTPERALDEARASEARYRAGSPLSPLDGVPLAWKDLLDLVGTRTTAGSHLLGQGAVKTADHILAARATAAGMVNLGKLNMTELAFSGLGLNPNYGTARNPWGKSEAHAPGGSSSGSGTAVAARLVPIAIGTDTGGSVRVPAAFNGVVGFKTSTGRIEKGNMIPLARSFDTVGPLARSVEDCALMDGVLRGGESVVSAPGSLVGLAVVVPENIVFDDAEDAVKANFERTLRLLEDGGARIRRMRLESLDAALAVGAQHGSLVAAEAYEEYGKLVEGPDGSAIDRRVVARILGGKPVGAAGLEAIRARRVELKKMLAGELDGALLAMPTVAVTAPKVAPLEADDAVFHNINILVLRNTALGNMLDLCGVALPDGLDGGGMPTSFLLSAVHGEDKAALAAAWALESAIGDWRNAVS